MNGIIDLRAAVMSAVEDRGVRESRYSARLGASQIGHECDRRLWLQLHWARKEHHDGRMHRLFAVGHAAEPRIIADLEEAGMEVTAIDESTGKQFAFTHCGGHLVTKIDGVVIGVPGAEKTWHLLELKTANANRFRSISKGGCQNSGYWVQVQISMRLAGLERCLFVVENKDDSDLYIERVKHVPSETDAIIERCDRITNAATPPDVSYKPSYYRCKMCHFAPLCHEETAPDLNCRTCCYATQLIGGRWTCDKHNRELTLDEQQAACDEHLFVPHQFGQAESFEFDGSAIVYRMKSGLIWANCGGTGFPRVSGHETTPEIYASSLVAGMPLAERLPF